MAQHGLEHSVVVCVFAEGVIVRNRLRLGIDDKFVGIPAARLAVESIAPLTKNLFQPFARYGRDLADRFNAHGPESAFCNFSNSRDFSDGQLLEKALLASGGDPHKP